MVGLGGDVRLASLIIGMLLMASALPLMASTAECWGCSAGCSAG